MPYDVGHGEPVADAPATGPVPVLAGDLLRRLAEQYDATWNAKDLQGFLACHTEDAMWEMPLIYPDGVARGHAAIAAECRRAWRALTDVRYRTLDLFVSLDGTRAAQWWTGRGVLAGPMEPPGYAPTNRPVEITGVSIWEIRGQRLSRVIEYFDTIAVGRQVGLLSPPGTVGDRVGVLLQRLVARRMRRAGDRAARSRTR